MRSLSTPILLDNLGRHSCSYYHRVFDPCKILRQLLELVLEFPASTFLARILTLHTLRPPRCAMYTYIQAHVSVAALSAWNTA